MRRVKAAEIVEKGRLKGVVAGASHPNGNAGHRLIPRSADRGANARAVGGVIAITFPHSVDNAKFCCVLTSTREDKQGMEETEGDITFMTTKGTIIKGVTGKRYLLTSRRIVELDGLVNEPWYATNKAIRNATEQLPLGYITINSWVRNNQFVKRLSLSTQFGKSYFDPLHYRIGCAYFDFKTFKRILRNAGVQGTQKKAFAAKAGA